MMSHETVIRLVGADCNRCYQRKRTKDFVKKNV